MKKRIGCYPRVRVEGGGRGVVSQAGAVLLVEIARKAGLDQATSAALAPWRRPRAVHDPGKILLDVALAVALGGDCLADVGMLRAELGVFGPVASDPTVSRLVDALDAAGPKALSAIRAARAEARERVWNAAPDAGGQVSRALIHGKRKVHVRRDEGGRIVGPAARKARIRSTTTAPMPLPSRTPTSAGKAWTAGTPRRAAPEHPHVGGEDSGRRWNRVASRGTPPRRRGGLLPPCRGQGSLRNTPASAGRTRRGSTR